MGLRGPKPWKPTEEQIKMIRLYSGLGSTQEQIAVLIGKSVDTMSRNETAKQALDEGRAETIAKVAGTLVQKALKGDTTSAIFYLKTQAGWKETHGVDMNATHKMLPGSINDFLVPEDE